jgi:hypothetical protein
VELNGEPVPSGVNVNAFFSVDSKDVVTGGVFDGPPNVKPTGFPMLPPEVPGLVTDCDTPKVNLVPVDGKPPNGDGAGLSLSKLVLPKRLVVGGDVEIPNPPNGPAVFSVLVFPNPPNTLVAAGLSDVLDDSKRDEEAVFSFSLSSLRPNPEVVVDTLKKPPVLVEADDPNRDPEDVELEDEPPNKLDLELTSGGSPVDFFASEEAKKFGMAEEGLLSELGVLLKPNVGAGGPSEESEAGVEGNVKLVDDFELSIDVRGMKPLGF